MKGIVYLLFILILGTASCSENRKNAKGNQEQKTEIINEEKTVIKEISQEKANSIEDSLQFSFKANDSIQEIAKIIYNYFYYEVVRRFPYDYEDFQNSPLTFRKIKKLEDNFYEFMYKYDLKNFTDEIYGYILFHDSIKYIVSGISLGEELLEYSIKNPEKYVVYRMNTGSDEEERYIDTFRLEEYKYILQEMYDEFYGDYYDTLWLENK